jgi:hypothetical protein
MNKYAKFFCRFVIYAAPDVGIIIGVGLVWLITLSTQTQDIFTWGPLILMGLPVLLAPLFTLMVIIFFPEMTQNKDLWRVAIQAGIMYVLFAGLIPVASGLKSFLDVERAWFGGLYLLVCILPISILLVVCVFCAGRLGAKISSANDPIP